MSISRVRIPQDIAHQIILNLEPDEPTLRDLSLICRAFVHPAQALLFKAVHLSSKGRHQKFRVLLQMSPHINVLVRHIHLSSHKKQWMQAKETGDATVGATLQALVKLQSVSLCCEFNTGWATLLDELKVALMAILQSSQTTKATLHGIKGAPFNELASCTNIKELSIQRVTFDVQNGDHVTPRSMPLQTLHVEALRDNDIAPIMKLLTAASLTLESFEICIDHISFERGPNIFESISMADLSRLRFLKIRVTYVKKTQRHAIAKVATLLKTIALANKVEELTCDLIDKRVLSRNTRDQMKEWMAAKQWKELDAVVTERFLHLRKLNVGVSIPKASKEVETDVIPGIKQQLPKAKSREILMILPLFAR